MMDLPINFLSLRRGEGRSVELARRTEGTSSAPEAEVPSVRRVNLAGPTTAREILSGNPTRLQVLTETE